VDASAFMAGTNWSQSVATVADLAAAQAPGALIQIVALSREPTVLTGDASGGWISAADQAAVARALQAMRSLTPAGDSSLDQVSSIISARAGNQDNIYLLASGLPTVSSQTGNVASTNDERYALFLEAAAEFSEMTPVNVLLIGSENGRRAAQAYWMLSLGTGGSLVAVASDWP
jgi:hypothetical protein